MNIVVYKEVEVDVDTADFETSDLIQELKDRKVNISEVTGHDTVDIASVIRFLYDASCPESIIGAMRRWLDGSTVDPISLRRAAEVIHA